MAGLTVGQVVRMPVLRAARPKVLAGAASLERRVRWVHTTELADIAPLLRGGDLVLSTGIALPDKADELGAFAESLAESESAGLLIELGRRWATVPVPLITACERLGLPLVALGREIRFAEVAQAVGERIVADQLAELREAERVHDTFTALSIAEAGPAEILEAVQRLAGAAVVLEDEQHRVLDYRAGPEDIGVFLAGWQSRSRGVEQAERTAWDETNGWLLTRLGRRDRGWGRLIVQAPTAPAGRLIVVAERAAAALAMHRLQDRQRDSLVRRTHHELLIGLLADPAGPDLVRRCELSGLPMGKRNFVGLTIRPRVSAPGSTASVVEDALAAVVHSVHEMRVPALVCEIDRDVRVLLSLPPSAKEKRLVDDLAERVARRHPVVVGAGRGVPRTGQIDRSLREAQHVVESLREDPGERVVYRLEDVHLRGLLTLLGPDDRLRLFVARELDPLAEHDRQTGDGLLNVLRALLEHPSGKSDAAASLHLSRAAFYDRLAKIEKLLGASLQDPDIRVSLHVALIAADLAAQ
ncbi:PucR family transcriptional regulator [Amycolatopsis pithecellobii]|uniref:PucR family transcriptional regulator n=1 Tax=Amycolatopsis pithecellobii TaxID=664692 RepID=A0A6N7YJF6_9PSEU|nr:PucR family transcriptional regulator [Amycolatopsis pithecellobii]MTD53027.1 PucR family transcriptional regulator [Amycolatopsis pithecellobii]